MQRIDWKASIRQRWSWRRALRSAVSVFLIVVGLVLFLGLGMTASVMLAVKEMKTDPAKLPFAS